MQCGGRWGHQIDGFGDGFEHDSVILKTKSETKHAWAPGLPQWGQNRRQSGRLNKGRFTPNHPTFAVRTGNFVFVPTADSCTATNCVHGFR